MAEQVGEENGLSRQGQRKQPAQGNQTLCRREGLPRGQRTADGVQHACQGHAQPATQIPAQDDLPAGVGQHGGEGIPLGPLIIGHQGHGEHQSGVDHKEGT